MSIKHKIRILLIVEGVLLSLFIVGLVFSNRSPLASNSKPLVRGYEADDVHSVAIYSTLLDDSSVVRSADGMIVLTTVDENSHIQPQSGYITDRNWGYVQGVSIVPADNQKIGLLLEEIEKARILQTVTNNAEQHSQFYVDDENADRLVLRDENDKVLAELLFGGPGPQSSIYFREVDKDTVYTVSAGLEYYVSQNPEYWQRTRIFPVSVVAQNVTALSFNGNIYLPNDNATINSDYSFVRTTVDEGTYEWTTDRALIRPLDQNKIDNLISSLVALNAQEITTVTLQQLSTDRYIIAAEIEIQTNQSGSYILQIFELSSREEGDMFWLLATGDGLQTNQHGASYVYGIKDWALRALVRDFDEYYIPQQDSELIGQ